MKKTRVSELAARLRPYLGGSAGASSVLMVGGGGDPGSHVHEFADLEGFLLEGQAPWVDDHIAAAIEQFLPHGMLDPVYHNIEGPALAMVGLIEDNTLGLLYSTDDGKVNFDTILRSGPTGGLTLATLETDFVTAPDDLYVFPTSDLWLAPGGSILVADGTEVRSEGYTPSGVAGYRLTTLGNFDGVSVTANEITARQSLFAAGTGFRAIYHSHDYDHVHVVVNPGPFWNLDEQFGVDIDDNLLVRGYIVGKHAIQLPGSLMICHYDGPEPYETNFKGNATGHMGQVGTVTGGVTYRPGKFGKGVQVAPGAVNYFLNPSFENGAYAFAGFGSGTGEQGVSQARAFVGNSSYKVTKSGGTNGSDYGVYTQVGTTPGQAYTCSAWVYVESLSGTDPRVSISLQSHTGSQDIRDFVTVPTNEWVRLTASFVADTIALSFFMFFQGGYGTFYVDAIQCELGTVPTPYLDGSMTGDNIGGHYWTDAPHASWSVRQGASLAYSAESVLSPSAITAGAWVRRAALTPGYIVAHPSITIEFL